MLRSLYAGITGLNEHQKSMDVIGNNIANVNTVGYKTSRIVFQDLLFQTISGGKAPAGNLGGINPKQIGTGTSTASVDTIFTQGTLQNTGVTTDMAIQGNGFFVVRSENENENYYTRAGNFTFDKDGYLVTPDGFIVQGWMADADTGEILTNTEVSDIQLSSAYTSVPAKATTEVSLVGNLDTRAEPTILEFQPLMTTATSNDNIFDLYSSNGLKLDLVDGEPVRIKAHATDITDMAAVYNDNDVNLGLDSNPTLNLIVNGNSYALTYSSSTNADTANNDNQFHSVQGFLSELKNILDTESGGNYTVSISNGEINVQRVSGDLVINSFSGNPNLAALLQPLVGTYNSVNTSSTSNSLFYEKVLTAGNDFSNLGDLAVQIQSAINDNVSTGFVVDYNNTSTGKFTYDNTSGNNNITGFSIDKAYSGTVFESNMVTSDTISVGNYTESNIFLRLASETDSLNNLYTNSGVSLGLDNNTTIQFDAQIGGDTPNGNGVNNISVANNTVGDLLDALEAYMALPTDSIQIENGKIKVTGEKGIPNSIDYINFSATGPNTYATFTDYMKYQTLQNASGGQLVTSQTIYDAQGNPHVVNYKFELYDEANNEWKLTIEPADSNDSISVDGTTGNTVIVRFNQDGSFQGVYDIFTNNVLSNLSYTLSPSNGASIMSGINVNLGTPGNYDGMTLSASDSTITETDQNGYPMGSLERISVNDTGEIVGAYTNGEIKKIAQVGIAIFTNQEGLLKVGDTLFAETPNSGQAAVGQATTGGRGSIAASALENSNVDLAREFVNMITTQRGFQANSRVITTSDELLQELMNLKR
ncbi:flagellar hook protein FlgE [Deferribacter desulfuricans SSM1]|uniref:Flagellar hook protein FlgE n=1 Tax=Deferribacter desulfuricans (strain DSM 14783 / JCM 11476 / NBRC 101012 / SSM1) TaxID=639282 RepID=D3P8Y5_DEFDS|nr:flagellar hook-basal body complex protein [Deferribacter desulfuricans]BAI81175.1 flagellar hook protein FlgE [Deferribacter desulfuricans SSM1]